MTTIFAEPLTVILDAQQCGACGVWFGIDREQRNKLIATSGSFYCPNGHQRQFVGETEAERLKKQLALTERSLQFARESITRQSERASRAERSVSARKAVITRMKRRVKKGRCVCCSHEFKDLARHMKAKHPKFEPENHVGALEAKVRS